MGWELEELEQAAHLVAEARDTPGDSTQDLSSDGDGTEYEDDSSTTSSESSSEQEDSSSSEMNTVRQAVEESKPAVDVTLADEQLHHYNKSVSTDVSCSSAAGGLTDSPVARNAGCSITQLTAAKCTVRLVSEDKKAMSVENTGHESTNSGVTHQSTSLCDDDVAGLSDDLHSILTLQCTPTTSCQKLIEELN